MQQNQNHINKKWVVIALMSVVVVIGGLFLYDRHHKNTTPSSYSDFVMDTVVIQQLYGVKADEAATEVIDRMRRYEQMCSYYIETSQLSAINKAAGKSYVAVDSQLFDLIKMSKDYAAQTKGMFDITVAPLVQLWGVTSDSPKVPAKDKIDFALSLIDSDDILLKEDTREVMLAREGMEIDLGGIAKGYSCSIAKQVYSEFGIKAGWISIGGNIYTYGITPDKQPYEISISAPVDNRAAMLGRVNVGEWVIASSGGYERYFEQDGQVYHHIFDVRTGYPSQSDLAGVTVLCQNGAQADMLSTYFFVMGTDSVKALLADETIGIIACDKECRVYVSNWLQDSFALTNESYTLWEEAN